MRNIKLFIDKKLVDLDYSNFNIVLNRAISDFNDLSSRKGSYSFTFSLPITSTNQKIFRFINNIDVVNKFKKASDYSAQLYVDDNLIFEGVFVLQNIDKKRFRGNLNVKVLDVFNLIGEKSLRDLQLPEIDFEGVQFLYETAGNTDYNYSTGSDYMLNKSLGFDMMALLNGFKNPYYGLQNTSIDYRDYYTVSLLNYYNQYIENSDSVDKLIPKFTIYDLMPNIRIVKVLEQIFKDVGLNLIIENELLNNKNILMPFTGETYPVFNWKHLASLEVCSDQTAYGNATTSVEAILYWENKQRPVIISQQIFKNLPTFNPDIDNDVYGLQTITPQRTINQFQDKIFSNEIITNGYTNTVDFIKKSGFNASNQNVAKNLHYIPTNKLKKDPNNNFNISSQTLSNDVGWSYTCPVNGDYEFEIENKHEIRVFNLLYKDTLKNSNNLGGYNDISYDNGEQFYYQNCVMFVKEDESSANNFFGVDDTMKNLTTPQNKNIYYNHNTKRLCNFNDENVIAFYHPMLRDLHKGEGSDKTLEEYFNAKGSILKETNTYPKTDDDRINYYGFNLDTTILNYENKIYAANYPSSIQNTKKLVPLRNDFASLNTPTPNGISNGENAQYSRRNFVIGEKTANGVVRFKFKTKLKKGESIRMYYLTYNVLANNAVTDFEYQYYNEQYHYFNKQINYSFEFPYMYLNANEIKTNPYGDMYTDDINVNSYKITPLFGDTKLKLANFLPNIKQKDFLTDYIKSNNIYFDIKDNNITFKSRQNFYKDKIQKDLTNNIDINDIQIEATQLYEKTLFGLNHSVTDDLRENIIATNPIKNFQLDKNIYTNKTTLDNTSKLFVSSFKKNFRYYKNFDATNITTVPETISLINLTQDNKINNFNSNLDNEAGFNTSNRLIIESDNYFMLNSVGNINKIKINKIKFETMNGLRFDIPVMKVNLPDLYYDNETIFNKLFNDRFINLEDSSIVTYQLYLTPLEYSQIDLSKPVKIQNTLYYIQALNKYNALKNNLCEIVLLKI